MAPAYELPTVSRGERFFVVGFVILVAGIRVWACLDDFWLDEIWSWRFAAQAGRAHEILTVYTHDNNHPLNTWLIYILGVNQHWVVYRIPAVVAGAGTVVLAWSIARRWGRVEAFTALWLVGTSFLMIQYSSEARGYAYALFFALAVIELFERSLAGNRASHDLGLNLAMILGLLSHLSFVFVYAALVIWSAVAVFRVPAGWRQRLFRLLRWHGASTLFLAWYYLAFIQRMHQGGAEPFQFVSVLQSSLSLSIGGPEVGWGAAWLSIVIVAGVLAGLVILIQRRADVSIFLSAAIFVVPVIVLALRPPDFLYVRYFLAPLLLCQLLLSVALGQLYRWSRAGKTIYVLLMLAITAGNCIHVAGLLRDGRGHYQAAVRFMHERTTSPLILVSGDHDFRNEMVLRFYQQRLFVSPRVAYMRADRLSPGGVQWHLRHSFSRDIVPAATCTDMAGNTYRLARLFPYSGQSGWHWLVYHNENWPPLSSDKNDSELRR